MLHNHKKKLKFHLMFQYPVSFRTHLHQDPLRSITAASFTDVAKPLNMEMESPHIATHLSRSSIS